MSLPDKSTILDIIRDVVKLATLILTLYALHKTGVNADKLNKVESLQDWQLEIQGDK